MHFLATRRLLSLSIGCVLFFCSYSEVMAVGGFGEGAVESAAVGDVVVPDTTAVETEVSAENNISVNLLVDSVLLTSVPVSTSTDTTLYRGNCPIGNTAADYFLRRINPYDSISTVYIPHSLVAIEAYVHTKDSVPICVTEDTAKAFIEMQKDAADYGLQFLVTSGYRSAHEQGVLYEEYAPRFNIGEYDRVAKPGHSEHQLGTALDIAGISEGYQAGYAFADSPEWQWLQKHAHTYGFVVSYGQHKEEATGYYFEPWHIRYVGKTAATIMHIFDHTLAYVEDYRSFASVMSAFAQRR